MNTLLPLAFVFHFTCLPTQPDIIKWQPTLEVNADYTALLTMRATLQEGWYIYSQFLNTGGPIPTKITVDAQQGSTLPGTIKEFGNSILYYDSIYEMEITKFTKEVVFEQWIKLRCMTSQLTITLQYMVCNDHACLPVTKSLTLRYN
jgi:hypothetical protein